MTEIQIKPLAPIQAGNLTLFRLRFLDEDGVALDLSSSSDWKIVLSDPSGAVTVNNAALTTDGSDGMIQAALTPSLAGTWRVQGRITLDGATKHSSKGTFAVEHNL